MKLWIDDVRSAPEGYLWCRSVNEAKACIHFIERHIYLLEYELENANKMMLCVIPERYRAMIKMLSIQLIDIDHDAGDYARDGGDYIKLLDWLEETGRKYPIHIHSMNPVGVANMRRIIQRNGWTEI